MLNRLETVSNRGQVLNLRLTDPSNGYLIQDIQGLDPVPAVMTSSAFANQDGEQYQNSRREKRNIVLKIELKAEYLNRTVQELRNDLYQIFMPKLAGVFRFHFDGLWKPVEIDWRVESFDCPIFTKDPVATISLICYDPDFHELEPLIMNGQTTAGEVSFNLPYKGTVDTGFLFRIMPNRSISGFTIYHTPEGQQTRQMDVTYNMGSGDNMRINTQPGEKEAVWYSGTLARSVLWAIDPVSSWLRLQPGNNNIRVLTPGVWIPWTIEYVNKYGGL